MYIFCPTLGSYITYVYPTKFAVMLCPETSKMQNSLTKLNKSFYTDLEHHMYKTYCESHYSKQHPILKPPHNSWDETQHATTTELIRRNFMHAMPPIGRRFSSSWPNSRPYNTILILKNCNQFREGGGWGHRYTLCSLLCMFNLYVEANTDCLWKARANTVT